MKDEIVIFRVCPVHGPVSMNALTCPRPVPANDPTDPQATNVCAIKLTPRRFVMLPEPPPE